MGIELANNAHTTLAANISSTDTVVTVVDVSSFPTLGASEYFYCTLESTTGAYEIVKVTQVNAASFNVERAQEGTIAIPFNIGARVELRVTVSSLDDRIADAQIFTVENGTTSRPLRDRFTDRYNAIDWGVSTTATAADNSTNLQLVVDQAVADGKNVYVPAGRYAIATAVSNLGTCVEGDEDQTIFAKEGSGQIFNSYGDAPSTAQNNTLASDASRGAMSITLSSGKGANFEEDTYAVLISEGTFPKAGPNKLGEFIRIRAISGDTLSLAGPLKFSYATADTAQLCPVALLEGVGYSNIVLEMDTTQPTIAAGTDDKELACMNVRWALEPWFENVVINGGLGAGIRLEGCLDARVNSYYCNDLGSSRNDADGSSDRGFGGFGYSIVERGMNQGLVATDLHISRCRHGYTTGGSYESFTYGAPNGSQISDGVHIDSKEAGWDTHETGHDITFDNLTTNGSMRTGFLIRSHGTKVLNCTAKDTFGSGIWLYGAESASNANGDECYVANFTAKNTNYGHSDPYDSNTDWREDGAVRDQGFDNVIDGLNVYECGGPVIYTNTSTKRGFYRNINAVDPCQVATTNTRAVVFTGTTTDTPRIHNMFVRDNDANVTDLVRTVSLNVTPELVNIEGIGHSGQIFSSAGANNNARVMLLGRGPHASNIGYRENGTIASDALAVGSLRGGVVQVVPESSSSDNLATLSGGEDGDRILLFVAGAYTITVKDGTGNIQTAANADQTLTQGMRMQLTNHAGTWYEDWNSATQRNFTGTVTFTSSTPPSISSATPQLRLEETDGGSNEKVWALIASGGDLTVRTQTDAYGAGTTVVTIDRGTGTAVNSMAVNTTLTATGVIAAASGTAIPAGGSTSVGLKGTSTTNFGVFFGSGAPSLSAAKGSLYLRSDGSTTNDRAYINTNGGSTWTALTTVA